MIALQKITLADQDWLKTLLQNLKPTLSEYTFGNIFLFQAAHWYEWFEFQGRRYIKGLSYTSEWFLIPLYRPTSKDTENMKEALRQTQAAYFYPISDDWKEGLIENWQSEFFQSESDYLYTTETIRTYPGREFDGRRNLVHQFMGSHQVTSKDLSVQTVDDARNILSKWFAQHRDAESEIIACLQALAHWNTLSLFGRITYADEQPVGFTIGEKLNSTTFALHFAKGSSQDKGVYQYIYQDLAAALPKEYIYMNWEQDLGIIGLRTAKEAYKPLSHLVKWRLSERSH